MLHWLHSLLPHIPRYGFVLVFIVVFLSNIGVPPPGKTIVFGIGIMLGKAASSLWQPMVAAMTACFLGGICSFWLGRRLGHAGLAKIHWLHLTPERLKWPQEFFKQYGAKSVFIARFIPLLPPVAVNLLAGMTEMSWRIFLFYNLTGSAIWAPSYILIGYFFGKKWKVLEAWLGPTAPYLILAGIALTALAVIFRHSLPEFLAHVFSKNRKRK
jgi:membrane-associated protein